MGRKYGYSRSGMRGMEWVDLVPETDRWRELVKEVINLRVP